MGQHRHKIVPCFGDPRNLFAATPQHFDGPDAYGHLGSRVDGPGTGSLGNAPERIGKIRTEPPRERLDQFRTSQNSFFFEVVTTKSLR